MVEHMVAVVGMHRSGTSAMMNLLAAEGVDIGPTDDLMDPQPYQPHGYAEHWTVCRAHDHLLRHYGVHWDTDTDLPADYLSDAIVSAFQGTMGAWMATNFSGPIAAIKDPRISRLVPVWDPIWFRLGITPHYLVMHRDPVDVAQSLIQVDAAQNRHTLHTKDSYIQLAHRYHAEALALTMGRDRLLVEQDDLRETPETVRARWRAWRDAW